MADYPFLHRIEDLPLALATLEELNSYSATSSSGATSYDANPDEYGIAAFTTPKGLGTGGTATAARIVDANPANVVALARNTTQVLNIVTGGGAVNGTVAVSPAMGVFFPAGMNAGPNGLK